MHCSRLMSNNKDLLTYSAPANSFYDLRQNRLVIVACFERDFIDDNAKYRTVNQSNHVVYQPDLYIVRRGNDAGTTIDNRTTHTGTSLYISIATVYQIWRSRRIDAPDLYSVKFHAEYSMELPQNTTGLHGVFMFYPRKIPRKIFRGISTEDFAWKVCHLPGPFLLSYSVFDFIFYLTFFVSGP